jgi:hypothetical protein
MGAAQQMQRARLNDAVGHVCGVGQHVQLK